MAGLWPRGAKISVRIAFIPFGIEMSNAVDSSKPFLDLFDEARFVREEFLSLLSRLKLKY